MKKFYSFLCAAVALVGFAACSTDATEEVAPAGAEKVSFTAAIENTKTDLDEANKTTWVAGDVVMIEGYEFVCAEDAATFSCTTPGVSALLNKEVEAVYSNNKDGKVDSEAGKAGAVLTATGTLTAEGATFNFAVQNAFLHFTATGAVTLKADQEIFSKGKELTIEEAGEYYVAINPAEEVAFSYESNGVEMKSTTITFAKKTIYNLGELEVAVAYEKFGIVGAHQTPNIWNTENPDALYQIPGSNTYVRYNVTLAEEGFKFYGTETKTITVEHPAVTTGEEGDWYLEPNSNWTQANARFAIYFFNNSGNTTWVDMKDENGDGIYVANNPTDGKSYTHMIFVRMSPTNTANNWNNKWNQTADLKIPTNGDNLFSVPSGAWDNSATGWSKHTPEVKDAWTEEREETTVYWIGTAGDNGDDNGWVVRWSTNTGGDNITVADTSKTYDIYFSKGEDQDWGFEIFYAVLEHGSEAPVLK